MYNQTSQKGYSLIEVMIAVAILMMAIVAPMTIAIKSIQSSQYTLEQNTAIFLAQEGISIIEALRNHYALASFDDISVDPWEWTTNLSDCDSQFGCNFDASDPLNIAVGSPDTVACSEEGTNCVLYYDGESSVRSAYRTDNSSGVDSGFTRRVFFEGYDVNADVLNVLVEVEWDSHFLGKVQRVSIRSSFYNLYGGF